jgi:hypothetical protein
MPKQKKAPKKQESVSDAERIAKGQILARIIIEVLGAPKEHVEEAIKLVVDKIRDSKDMEILSESTYEAVEKGKLFTTFSELEIWFNGMDDLIQFMFNFTPSSVEIVRPTQLSIPALHLNGLFNDFLLKMHDLGLKMKDTSASMQLLKKNTDVLIRNFLNFVLKEPRSSEEVSKLTGIPKENVSALLANFEKAGIVERQGDSYVLRSEKERKGKNV